MTHSSTSDLIFWFVGHVGCHVPNDGRKCPAGCVECVWLDAAIAKQLVSTRWTMVEVRVDALSEKAVVNLQPVQWCPRRGFWLYIAHHHERLTQPHSQKCHTSVTRLNTDRMFKDMTPVLAGWGSFSLTIPKLDIPSETCLDQLLEAYWSKTNIMQFHKCLTRIFADTGLPYTYSLP